jgi:hypothetical protein
MTQPTSAEAIAAGLTEAQRAALVPLLTFSDKTGREMKRLGLLTENDGVWHHTPLGLAVRQLLERNPQ